MEMDWRKLKAALVKRRPACEASRTADAGELGNQLVVGEDGITSGLVHHVVGGAFGLPATAERGEEALHECWPRVTVRGMEFSAIGATSL